MCWTVQETESVGSDLNYYYDDYYYCQCYYNNIILVRLLHRQRILALPTSQISEGVLIASPTTSAGSGRRLLIAIIVVVLSSDWNRLWYVCPAPVLLTLSVLARW